MDSGMDVFDHIFPYHLFREGERVAIYGAGNIGRKFWRQGREDRFVKLVGIVDRSAGASDGVPVEPVEALKGMAIDSVLVSVHGPEGTIREIRETLAALGIGADRVKWDGRTYHQGEFRRHVLLPLLRAIGDGFRDSAQMLGTLCRRIDTGIYAYVFPYRFFRPGERVAIYGAGVIGQCLYRQARRYGYVDVAAIVDPAREAQEIPDIPVVPPGLLREADPEAVLVAAATRTEAEAAKAEILGLGVPEERILWDPDGYARDACTRRYLAQLADRAEEAWASARSFGRMGSGQDGQGA